MYEFILGEKPKESVERTLATALFTDVVGSTALAGSMGDRRWREVVAAHDEVTSLATARFRGRQIKSLGDGVLAVFDGPSRAMNCALAVAQEVKKLGLEVRAGLHTGEIELSGGDVHGLAVNIASRIADHAGPGEVLVSRIVRDLAIGSEVRLREAGPHDLTGYPEPMELYAAG